MVNCQNFKSIIKLILYLNNNNNLTALEVNFMQFESYSKKLDHICNLFTEKNAS
jgi:hypothetical protein